MYEQKKGQTKQLYLLRLLVLVLIAVTIYGINALHNAAAIYDQTDKVTASQSVVAETVQIGDETVKIPSYDMFKNGNVWTIVSKKKPLVGQPKYTFIDIPVAHGDEGSPMKIAEEISDELQQLVNAAEADEEPLMVSSAYRSLEEQQATYDSFVKKNGKELASLYVSPVGASEHHTGLSVDFSSVSDDCAEDSNTCSLSQSGASWLAKNAHRFGFIQRYPEGKQPITGVGHEPWHYRFVGIPLAKALASTNITLDEAVMQIAPGYAETKSVRLTEQSN